MSKREPHVSPSMIMTIRSVVMLLLLTFIIKIDLKQPLGKALMEPMANVKKSSLALSLAGNIYETTVCVVGAASLPIVSVAIFVNMAPLITVLLAIWVLNERLTLFNGVQALGSFAGVVMIILGRELDQ